MISYLRSDHNGTEKFVKSHLIFYARTISQDISNTQGQVFSLPQV